MKKWNGQRAWSVVFRKAGESNWLIKSFNHPDNTVNLVEWNRPVNFAEISRHASTSEISKIETVNNLKKYYILFEY